MGRDDIIRLTVSSVRMSSLPPLRSLITRVAGRPLAGSCSARSSLLPPAGVRESGDVTRKSIDRQLLMLDAPNLASRSFYLTTLLTVRRAAAERSEGRA